MNEIEIWKEIPGYEGLYEASSFGNIKSISRNVLVSQSVSKKGYYRVNLNNNGIWKVISTHQLICSAFLGHERCGMKLIVNHIDGCRKNNKVENLEIVSSRYNTILGKSTRYNISGCLGVSWNTRNNKWFSRISYNKKIYHLGYFNDPKCANIEYKMAYKAIENCEFESYINEARIRLGLKSYK